MQTDLPTAPDATAAASDERILHFAGKLLADDPKFRDLVADKLAARLAREHAATDFVSETLLTEKVARLLADKAYPAMRSTIEAAVKPAVTKLVNAELGVAISAVGHRIAQRLIGDALQGLPTGARDG